MAGCVFCDILRGDCPASIVYEDEAIVAFMDLYPVHGGHTLVIPREHYDDLETCPGDLAGRLFELSARLGSAIVDAVGAAGFNVWTANGSAAGQEVFHLHLHVLPRFEEDTFGLRFPKGYPQAAGREELERMAELISSRL